MFPDPLKLATVTPIFKKGSSDKIDNYRLISVLPVLAMIFERVIYWQLSSYFWAKKLLSVNHSGFVPKSSCASLHLHINDYILDSFNGGSNVLAVLFDLSKAFDVLGHGILLKKLEC